MRILRVLGGIVLLGGSVLLAGCDTAEPYPTLERLTPGILLEPKERLALPEGVELRKVFAKGIDLTKLSEGFVSQLYNDAAGYCTIAYGHLIKLAGCDGSEPSEFREGVSEPRGAELLRGDMSHAEWAVMSMVDVDLTDGQYAALCDFVFNVGRGNFGRSTLLKVINAGEFHQVPAQLRRWVRAGGRELEGLKTRREREIKLFFEGMAIPRLAPSEGGEMASIDIRTGES